MRNYIDSCNKKSEMRAAYPKKSTAHFQNVANITIDSAIVITNEEQNGSQKYFQGNPYNQNETNKSIEENAGKTIEQKASKLIDFKAYLNNMVQKANLLTTPLGKSITRNMMTGK